jgi:hypothetical protein
MTRPGRSRLPNPHPNVTKTSARRRGVAPVRPSEPHRKDKQKKKTHRISNIPSSQERGGGRRTPLRPGSIGFRSPAPGPLRCSSSSLSGRFEGSGEGQRLGFFSRFNPGRDLFSDLSRPLLQLQVKEDDDELQGLDLVPARVVAAVRQALRALLRGRRRRLRGRRRWYPLFLVILS